MTGFGGCGRAGVLFTTEGTENTEGRGGNRHARANCHPGESRDRVALGVFGCLYRDCETMNGSEQKCPVCSERAGVSSDKQGENVICPRCGNYSTHGISIIKDLCNDEYNKALVSHHIRRSQINRWPRFDPDTVEKITKEKKLPNVFEKCDFILEWIGNKSSYAGDRIVIISMELEDFSGAINEKEVSFCLSTLTDNKLLAVHSGPRYSLTFDGWKRYDELTKGKLAYNKAFMAMKFGTPVLDTIFKDHFKPAVEQTGYQLFNLAERPKAGLIDIHMRQEIKTSKFIIADLTHDNLGAYWEAGFAEGLGKPVIYTCEKKKFKKAKTHFDVSHHLTIMWEEGKEEQASTDLKAAIRYTFPEARQQDE